jgi:protein gp37
MGESTKIQWADHTFNPWRGCTKVSAGCANCYAETQSKRNTGTLGVWGPNGTRVVASESMWEEPLRWNRQAKADGVRRRVFCASLADVFEDWRGPMVDSHGCRLVEHGGGWYDATFDPNRPDLTIQTVRQGLFDLIDDTPNLDWLLLTKRLENIVDMMPGSGWVTDKHRCIPVRPNVWLGTSVENQQTADERIPHLLKVPAAVRFLSVEPMLGPVSLDISRWVECYHAGHGGRDHEADHGECACHLDWVIVGGESGGKARPCRVEWVRSLVRQCQNSAVPCFVKQLGGHVIDRNDNFGGWEPHQWPETLDLDRVQHDLNGYRDGYQGADVRIRLLDTKGGDMSEWPPDLRVRELPVAKGVRS